MTKQLHYDTHDYEYTSDFKSPLWWQYDLWWYILNIRYRYRYTFLSYSFNTLTTVVASLGILKLSSCSVWSCGLTKPDGVMKMQRFPLIFNEIPIVMLQLLAACIDILTQQTTWLQVTQWILWCGVRENPCCTTATQPCWVLSQCQLWCKLRLTIVQEKQYHRPKV